MGALGLAVLMSSLCGADVQPAPTPAANVTLEAVKLLRGEEHHFTGEIIECGERLDNRYRKSSKLELRLFVLDSKNEFADCALLTSVQQLDDPIVMQAVASITGNNSKKPPPPPTLRMELLRVDSRGRVCRLNPKVGQPPLELDKNTPSTAMPAIPLDAPAPVEFGFFVPLPIEAVRLQSKWDIAEVNRPPHGWHASGLDTWNGGRALVLRGLQQSEEWDHALGVKPNWRRTDVLLVPPGEGFAANVQRLIERREGKDYVSRILVKYERKASSRYVGDRFNEVRAEVEAAWWLLREVELLESKGQHATANEFKQHSTRVEQYLKESRNKSPFRDVIEATKLRAETGGLGQAPAVIVVTAHTPEAKTETLTLEKVAPDFVVPDVERPTGRLRLSSLRGKPVVLVFYKPNSVTSVGALQLVEALHKKFQQRVAVVPLACVAGSEAATEQKAKQKLTPTVYDGDEVAKQYKTTSYPRFLVLDSGGLFRWEMEGVGPETGYLIKQQLEKLLAEEKKR